MNDSYWWKPKKELTALQVVDKYAVQQYWPYLIIILETSAVNVMIQSEFLHQKGDLAEQGRATVDAKADCSC
jgi:hypothetical protein